MLLTGLNNLYASWKCPFLVPLSTRTPGPTATLLGQLGGCPPPPQISRTSLSASLAVGLNPGPDQSG